MKSFTFRLEKLLRLKERIETLKRGEYGAAVQKVNDRQQALQALEDERIRCCEAEQERLKAGTVDVASLQMYSRYFHHLRAEKTVTTQIKAALQKKADEKQKELVESSRDKKALEQYKEKLKLRHIREMDKVEQQELDELGAVRYIRKAKEQLAK